MKKVIILLTLLNIAVLAQQQGTFADPRDKKKYNTIKIGMQTWMAQNLDYQGADGFLGLCYGDDPRRKIRKPENCQKYGRLYDWEEANKACPSGWHLPSDKEWQTLVNFAGGNEAAAKKLKAKNGWPDELDNRGRYTYADDFGFSALPGGYWEGGFANIGYFGYWWTKTVMETTVWGNQAYIFTISNDDNKVFKSQNSLKALNSVRCVKDDSEAEAKAKLEAEAKAKAEANAKLDANRGTFTDSRDKKDYKTIKIGSQIWMAENLNYEVKGFLTEGNSKCYDNNPANCIKYGRLYNRDEAMKACPKGWHLPSDAEWQKLIDFAGGNKVAGTKLKATSDWKNDDGTDDFGFSALPGGQFNSAFSYGVIGEQGQYWSSESKSSYGTALYIYSGQNNVELAEDSYYPYLHSVRCLKN
ncbi:MAG: hypothetical protein FWB90_09735 [Fibromonadales bacterium]|nr:hypothetical protein [Fibromonadales bacterium]